MTFNFIDKETSPSSPEKREISKHPNRFIITPRDRKARTSFWCNWEPICPSPLFNIIKRLGVLQ